MSQKLTDILKNIAIQSGISESDTALTALLGNAAISIDVDDAIATKLVAHRFTLEAAKNDPTLKNHFKAELLDGVDASIESQAKLYSLSDADIAAIKAEQKTTKRLEALAARIALKEKAASNATGKTQTELNKEIDRLNAESAAIRTDYEKKLADEKAARVQDRIKWTTDSIYNGFEYAIPKVDKETSILTAKSVIAKRAEKDGVVFKSTDDGRLILETTAGTKYFVNNKEIAPQDYIKRVATESGLLKISDVGGKNRQTGEPSAVKKFTVRGMERLHQITDESVQSNAAEPVVTE